MIREHVDLAVELGGHLLRDFAWESERGVQAHEGKRLQGSEIRAEEILSDDRLCAICTNEQIACGFGAVFKSRRDCWLSLLCLVGNGAEPLAIL